MIKHGILLNKLPNQKKILTCKTR